MKKSFLLLVMVFLAVQSFGSTPQIVTEYQEVIISVPSINSKNYTEIRDAIIAIDGVVLQAYCDNSKCFLINYDPKKIESGEVIARTIESLSPRYKTEIKVGTSINQLINGCALISTAVSTQTR